ncbi:hypothetical protein ACJIZ3_001203 [Penstemon smallii]|uniref:Protein kinase domain-containing protein n=1 Tax=Penstemon smallii TaxID=265156 RepID=A0ABD3U3C3_9LAMI
MIYCNFDFHLQIINSPAGLKIITILFLLITFVTPLTFNFTSFSPNDNIIYEPSAYLSNNVIQLTPSITASIGRATYAQPLHLWDKASGNLTDFNTNFSFVISSHNSSVYGDGVAFFLAPNGSRIPETKGGGNMGLTCDSENLNSSSNPFVAVEFDIISNPVWDPPNEHVGIDINSMRSVANVTWWSSVSIMEGRTNDVWISYDSQSYNLSVVFTGLRNHTYVRQTLSYVVDLRDHLPEFVTFGFSAATGGVSATQSIYSWSFSSNLETNHGTVPPDLNSGAISSKNKKGVVIGIALGVTFLLGMLGLLVYLFWRKRKITRTMNEVEDTFDVSIRFEQIQRPEKFAYEELVRATNNFSNQEKLGEGGFGGVYKGFINRIDSYVAVKRVSSNSRQGIKEFASEVKIISRLRHRNLVQLLGWCHEKKELILVYEFMPNGSLDYHLFKGKSMLDWGTRFKIAKGLASSVLYLHEEWEQCVVHRDIKSSNVMLDANFNAKLGDFGLARLVDHEKEAQTTVLAGTMGYMAPECAITGKASKETDVFSFGVVALEIATGRRPINPKAKQSEVNMVKWIWSLYGTRKLLEAADRQLGDNFNEEEMERLIIVGRWCAHPDSNLRPTIRQAILVLNCEAPLPILSLRMPEPTKFTLPMVSSSYEDIVSGCK